MVDIDKYAYWRDRLAGRDPPTIIDQPECGFYRMRQRDKKTGRITHVPVAYYPNGTEIPSCRVGDHDLTELRALEVWPWCGANPITEEVYRAVAENGQPWPDIDGAVSDQLAGIGDNNPPTDPLEVIKEQIAAISASVGNYAEIATDEELAKAQTVRSRLLELRNEADKQCDEEYRPHKKAADAVKAKWRSLLDDAKNAADRVLVAMNAYGTRQRDAAEAACKAAEEATRKATEAGTAPPPPPPQPPAAPAKVKGAAGRAASGKPVKVVKAITDIDAAFVYLKEQPDMRDSVLTVAQRLVTAGHTVPGIEVKEEYRYR